MEIKNLKIYKTPEGKEPYREWFLKLDNSQKVKIIARLKRVEWGNYGVSKNLSGGISELKFDSGLRVYFAELEKVIVLLLLGGGKQRQSDDIQQAQEYFSDYKERSRDNE